MITKPTIIVLDGSETKDMLYEMGAGVEMKKSAYHGFNAESRAMLQSLYSRSPKSVQKQIKLVMEKGAAKFMKQFYSGYGHKSIGDCGVVTIFVETVSMFVAKAIQDSRLYMGQEASTRYIDFTEQPINDPIDTPDSQEIIDRWMDFYQSSSDILLPHLRTKYPTGNDEDEETYERAIKARGFDVLRGFLPAGATTLVAWTVNLRQAADHLEFLLSHSMDEVRDVGMRIHKELAKRYPSSFLSSELSKEVIAYRHLANNYYWQKSIEAGVKFPEIVLSSNIQDLGNVFSTILRGDLFTSRPRKVELPKWMDELGNVSVKYQLDFGSFRDVQRHRAGTIRMPFLDMNLGFHEWYLNEMPLPLYQKAQRLITEQEIAIHKLWENIGGNSIQYLIPMGYKVAVNMTFGLPGLVYFLELRSGKTVHPTLRMKVHEIIKLFTARFPQIKLHADMDPDDWDVRRGKQTIFTDGKAISG